MNSFFFFYSLILEEGSKIFNIALYDSGAEQKQKSERTLSEIKVIA